MKPLRHAQSLINANISVIPIKTDGSKRPAIRWKTYQKRRMTVEEAERLFSSDCGIGIIAGAVSGNLELIDVEGRASVSELLDLIDEMVPGLLANIPQLRMPLRGLYLYCRSETIKGNQKLAPRATHTRGGGYEASGITAGLTGEAQGRDATLRLHLGVNTGREETEVGTCRRGSRR